jgi:hypothetical protein
MTTKTQVKGKAKSNNYFIYYDEDATTPILTYKEGQFVEFLEKLNSTKENKGWIVANNHANLEYPSSRIALPLCQEGFLESREMPTGKKGNRPLEYAITKRGERVLVLLQEWRGGLIHLRWEDITELLSFFEVSNPERINQIVVALAGVNLPRTTAVKLQEYVNNYLESFQAQAVNEFLTVVGTGRMDIKDGLSWLIHGSEEREGVVLHSRLDGMGTHHLKLIKEHLETNSDVDVSQWLLTLGALFISRIPKEEKKA